MCKKVNLINYELNNSIAHAKYDDANRKGFDPLCQLSIFATYSPHGTASASSEVREELYHNSASGKLLILLRLPQ